MNTKEKKPIFGLPSWVLSLSTAFIALIFLFIIASLLGSIPQIDKNFSEEIAYIVYDILIAAGCFFICKNNPKSIWYVPILSNTAGIISAFIEPNFWITSLWILICSGWILSLIGAIGGAIIGKQQILRSN